MAGAWHEGRNEQQTNRGTEARRHGIRRGGGGARAKSVPPSSETATRLSPTRSPIPLPNFGRDGTREGREKKKKTENTEKILGGESGIIAAVLGIMKY